MGKVIKEHEESNIIIYKTSDGQTRIDVRFDGDTAWLTQKQMAQLFGIDIRTINEHIQNIFSEGELPQNSTIRKFRIVQKEGSRNVSREISYGNLDLIISVGYRVKSKIATAFRQWATARLRQYLLDGYAVNKELLAQSKERFIALQKAVSLIGSVNERRLLGQDEIASLMDLLKDYAYGLELLDSYDKQNLKITKTTKKRSSEIKYQEAVDIIERMRKDLKITSDIFGREKDHSLRSSLAAIEQTFGGKALYPTIEEKAAHLLYFLVKNHSFIDGNKRIAAALFLVYMNKNGILYSPTGKKRLADSGLVALTILIAESKPSEKDDIIKLVVNLINKSN